MSDLTITLTPEEAEALLSIFDSAQRGRDDFEYLASQDGGDYSPEDLTNTRQWHAREQALEERLTTIIRATTPKEGT